MATRIVQVDLSLPLPTLCATGRESTLRLLITIGPQLLGWVTLPLERFGRQIAPTLLAQLIADQLCLEIHDAARNRTFDAPAEHKLPPVSLVLHTDQSQSNEAILQSIALSRLPIAEVILVDGSSNGRAPKADSIPGLRHIHKPGILPNDARNVGWREATNEWIVFTNADSVDKSWLARLATAHADSSAGVVCGAILPSALDTTAQECFDRLLRRPNEFLPRLLRPQQSAAMSGIPLIWNPAGVSLSVRRDLLASIGGFDATFDDCDSAAACAGQLDLLVRSLAAGHAIAFEPRAISFHRYPATRTELRRRMFDYGRAVAALHARRSHDLALAMPIAKLRRRFLHAHLTSGLAATLAASVESRRFSFGPFAYELAGYFAGRANKRRALSRTSGRQHPTANIQLEHLDLLHPWPMFALRGDCRQMCIFIHIGETPIGEVSLRPVRARMVSPARLRRRIARLHGKTLLGHLLHDGIAAGPRAIKSFLPGAWNHLEMRNARDCDIEKYVAQHLLSPQGLPSPLREWVIDAMKLPPEVAAPGITIAIFTRDSVQPLEACVLQFQKLATPGTEILIVDRSADPVPARESADRLNIHYVRGRPMNLAASRNLALAKASHPWVVFIDDDCRPSARWLNELLRATQDWRCGCACGPIICDGANTPADFIRRRPMQRTFADAIYSREFLTASRLRSAQTWWIGDGTNVLLNRQALRVVGGYDAALTADPFGRRGSIAQADLIYRLLRSGYNVHRASRAFVRREQVGHSRAFLHTLRADAADLAVYHASRIIRFGDYRSLIELVCRRPVALARNLCRALIGRGVEPIGITMLRAKSTWGGIFRYAAIAMTRALRRKNEDTFGDFEWAGPSASKNHWPASDNPATDRNAHTSQAA